jgi:hypothetical protein
LVADLLSNYVRSADLNLFSFRGFSLVTTTTRDEKQGREKYNKYFIRVRLSDVVLVREIDSSSTGLAVQSVKLSHAATP